MEAQEQRAIWLKKGDRNSKYFHNFANARRRKNSIWRIEDGKGDFLYSQQEISAEATSFFQNQYRRQQGNINDILWAVDLMLEMFDEAANDNFFKPVVNEELQAVIKDFKKDKIPGPNGWSIEFFSHFYDIFKADLLRMVEASRRSAERMKPVLNSFITRDQQAFLKDRNILDDVAMTQECLFSMLSNNIDVAILKIDLKKAYDCVDWGFLRILLAKIELRIQGINWIMSCVENVRYSVIINGITSSFFPAERGLRQGCPLSPLLFILVMNSLSLQINKAVAERRCRPIRIYKDTFLSHNLFVDDVLIFAMLCRATWYCLNEILEKFQRASGLVINKNKSSLYHNESNMDTFHWIADLIGINPVSIKEGFKYLGFNLKAKGNSK
eukprot:PITA_10356